MTRSEHTCVVVLPASCFLLEGSQFKFAEREVICSIANWLTERIFQEFSCSSDDLDPVESWRKKYFIRCGTHDCLQPLGNEPSNLNAVSWSKTALRRIDAATSNVRTSSSGVSVASEPATELSSRLWTNDENSVKMESVPGLFPLGVSVSRSSGFHVVLISLSSYLSYLAMQKF